MEVACVCCGSTKTKQDPFYYDWQDRRHWIRRCSTCSHQFVWPQITDEQQEEMYGDQYFSAGGDWVCGLFEGAAGSQISITERAQRFPNTLVFGLELIEYDRPARHLFNPMEFFQEASDSIRVLQAKVGARRPLGFRHQDADADVGKRFERVFVRRVVANIDGKNAV